MQRTSVTEFRENLGHVLNSVCYGGEPAIIQKNGKDCVAVVPVEALKLIELAEDMIDIEDAKKALAEGGGRPLEDVLRDLGIDKD